MNHTDVEKLRAARLADLLGLVPDEMYDAVQAACDNLAAAADAAEDGWRPDSRELGLDGLDGRPVRLR